MPYQDFQVNLLLQLIFHRIFQSVLKRYFAFDYENIHYFKEVFPKKIMIEKLIFDTIC